MCDVIKKTNLEVVEEIKKILLEEAENIGVFYDNLIREHEEKHGEYESEKDSLLSFFTERTKECDKLLEVLSSNPNAINISKSQHPEYDLTKSRLCLELIDFQSFGEVYFEEKGTLGSEKAAFLASVLEGRKGKKKE